MHHSDAIMQLMCVVTLSCRQPAAVWLCVLQPRQAIGYQVSGCSVVVQSQTVAVCPTLATYNPHMTLDLFTHTGSDTPSYLEDLPANYGFVSRAFRSACCFM